MTPLRRSRLNSATGLSSGPIRSAEWPHTEENYVLKEMGYRIARKHAARLRRIVHACAFALPLAATLLALAATGETAAALAAVFASLAIVPGMLAERWLLRRGHAHGERLLSALSAGIDGPFGGGTLRLAKARPPRQSAGRLSVGGARGD